MDFSALLAQLLNGLAEASSLFLVAVGLSLIFGVTRVLNFAHGSFFMVGIYLAYTLTEQFAGAGAWGYWGGMALAALLTGLLGAAVEIVLLRRIYKAPELFQLLATFALVLVAAIVMTQRLLASPRDGRWPHYPPPERPPGPR